MRFTFVGDIALGDHPKAVGFGFRSRYADGIPAERIARMLPPSQGTDFFFGNLEFSLGFSDSEAATLGTLQCRGLSEYAGFLRAAGVSALNVANNHSTQAGQSVFDTTASLLRRAGIQVVGTPTDFCDGSVLRVADQRIALLGWSDRPRQYSADRPEYNEFSEAAFEQIAAARRRADIVIASLHWGEEFILVPSDRERAIARRMIDAGATCVIGHHPHVVREVERYRHGVIAYSLGNFVCDMIWDERTRFSGWLSVEVAQGRVVDFSFVPAIIEEDYFPRAVADAVTERRWIRLERSRQADAEQVAKSGYSHAAETQRTRHATRTALMMLRNLHRYNGGIAVAAFQGALTHRLRALLPRRQLSSSS